MEYKREKNRVFTISFLVEQIAMWVKDNQRLPEKISLPPEEYTFLGWYRETALGTEKIVWETFRGIPLTISKKKQKYKFIY